MLVRYMDISKYGIDCNCHIEMTKEDLDKYISMDNALGTESIIKVHKLGDEYILLSLPGTPVLLKEAK